MFRPVITFNGIIDLLGCMYLFLAVRDLHCCMGFSLVVVGRGYRLVVVCQLLITWALGHAGFSSCNTWAQYLQFPGSRAQAQQVWYAGLVVLKHGGSS